MLDKNGKEIKVGDIVNIPVRIVEVFGGADFTDIHVETVHTHPPHNGIDRLGVSSAQVEAIAAAEDEKDEKDEKE